MAELQLKALKQEKFDVLVVGGGATGSGVALDCATRGLKVALIERDDFASGTSSRSTKLIHGGIRYLAQVLVELDLALFSQRSHNLPPFSRFCPGIPNQNSSRITNGRPQKPDV